MKRLWTTFRYTFTSLRGQILGWGLGVAALGLILVPFYDVFMGQQADFMQMIENYPPEFLAFFGGDANSLITPAGFLKMYAFSMMPVIIGIFAVIVGSGLIVSDEEGGRLDEARPVADEQEADLARGSFVIDPAADFDVLSVILRDVLDINPFHDGPIIEETRSPCKPLGH